MISPVGQELRQLSLFLKIRSLSTPIPGRSRQVYLVVNLILVENALQLFTETILDFERLFDRLGIRVVDSGGVLVILSLFIQSILKDIPHVELLITIELRWAHLVFAKTLQRSLSVSFHFTQNIDIYCQKLK